MKKFFAFMLVLAMIASMMCVNVSAAAVNVVGTRGERADQGTSVEDGAQAPFSKTSSASDVVANIVGTAGIRYAVDLEYTAKTITIKNEAVWDVNELMYIGNMYYSFDTTENKTYTAFPTSNSTTSPIGSIGDFKIKNYSNAAVYVIANVTDLANTTIKTVVQANDDETAISTGAAFDTIGAVPTTVNKNVAYAEADVPFATYSAYMTSENWLTDLWGYANGNEIVIAKITFSISSSAPAVQQTAQ